MFCFNLIVLMGLICFIHLLIIFTLLMIIDLKIPLCHMCHFTFIVKVLIVIPTIMSQFHYRQFPESVKQSWHIAGTTHPRFFSIQTLFFICSSFVFRYLRTHLNLHWVPGLQIPLIISHRDTSILCVGRSAVVIHWRQAVEQKAGQVRIRHTSERGSRLGLLPSSSAGRLTVIA